MKFIYPAVFHEEKDGKYKGYFPDLECCYGEGDTIDDAIDDANEAARNWLSLELTEEDPFIPYVSDEEDIDLKEGEFITSKEQDVDDSEEEEKEKACSRR